MWGKSKVTTGGNNNKVRTNGGNDEKKKENLTDLEKLEQMQMPAPGGSKMKYQSMASDAMGTTATKQ